MVDYKKIILSFSFSAWLCSSFLQEVKSISPPLELKPDLCHKMKRKLNYSFPNSRPQKILHKSMHSWIPAQGPGEEVSINQSWFIQFLPTKTTAMWKQSKPQSYLFVFSCLFIDVCVQLTTWLPKEVQLRSAKSGQDQQKRLDDL